MLRIITGDNTQGRGVIVSEKTAETSDDAEDLKPKKPTNKAPQGIRAFTMCRKNDETGISGEGVVIEGATFATGI